MKPEQPRPETADIDAETGCADDRLMASVEQVRNAAKAMGINLSEGAARQQALEYEVARLRDAVLRFCNVSCHDAETIRFLQVANQALVRGHRNSSP